MGDTIADMALFHVDMHSQVLKMASSMTVIIPEPAGGMIGPRSVASADPPVLYLLHGLSDDHTIWHRRTSIERYAAERGLAVVMPGVGRSYYTDMAHGPRYWTFVSDELPELVSSFFCVSTDPARTFVAGLSMGGYGAIKLALSYPERFAAAATFSGALDISARERRMQEMTGSEKPGEREWAREHRSIFGDPPAIAGTDRDLLHLAGELSKRTDGPRSIPIYQACGTEDSLYDQNTRFRDHLSGLGFDIEYREGPGAHEWGFWDAQVRGFIEWLVDRGLL